MPKKAGGRIAVLEVLKSTMRTREYLERGEGEGKSLLDAMRDGELDGMQYFDGELEKLMRADVITRSTASSMRPTPGNLQLQIADVPPDSTDTADTMMALGPIGSLAGQTRVRADSVSTP